MSVPSPSVLRKTAAALVLALVFAAAPASAQLVPGLTGIGVKGGVTAPTLRQDFDAPGSGDEIDPAYDFAFTGGIYGQLGLLPFITPQLEVLYVQKGATLEEEDGSGDTSFSYDVIEIPLLIKVNAPIVNRIFPNLYAGPYVSFAVNREIDEADEVSFDGDPEDAFKSTDYGIVIGTSVDFTFADRALTLSGRYDLGLNDIADDAFDDDEDLNTGTFIVTLGFSI